MKKITIKRHTRIEGHSDNSVRISDLYYLKNLRSLLGILTLSRHITKNKANKVVYTNEIIGVDDGV